jgi:hypothetical protein
VQPYADDFPAECRIRRPSFVVRVTITQRRTR